MHRPPPLDPLCRLLLRLLRLRPPPARGAGSSASASSSAGSSEQVPADRKLRYLCPRTGSNINLLKDISAKTGPTAVTLAPAPARGPAF
ncbi:unnamed protein product [Ectocarpus sp. 13 AM-2016]